jgi:predicted PurR-regulated permease PerM
LSQPIQIGPFMFDLSLLDVNNLTEQILNAIQPILSKAGSSVVSVASGAASLIGWLFFILIISYFILAESGGIRLISLSIPGHAGDVRRLGMQLGQIWNAFLRGQVIIVLITIVTYTVILGVLGVKFFFGLALLAGLARFVPYVGPFIAWTTYGLVAYFQGSTIFGISPFVYAGIVVGLAWVTDLFMDNYVTPLLMSNALKVHPAAVMVSALVALNLLGVVGVVLAAPVLATVQLLLNYIFAKLFDRNPWEGIQTISPPSPISHSLHSAQQQLLAIGKKVLKSRLTGAK